MNRSYSSRELTGLSFNCQVSRTFHGRRILSAVPRRWKSEWLTNRSRGARKKALRFPSVPKFSDRAKEHPSSFTRNPYSTGEYTLERFRQLRPIPATGRQHRPERRWRQKNASGHPWQNRQADGHRFCSKKEKAKS